MRWLRDLASEAHALASDYLAVPCSPTFHVIDRAGVLRFTTCGFREGVTLREVEAECRKLF